jgi:hypothetical protein
MVGSHLRSALAQGKQPIPHIMYIRRTGFWNWTQDVIWWNWQVNGPWKIVGTHNAITHLTMATGSKYLTATVLGVWLIMFQHSVFNKQNHVGKKYGRLNVKTNSRHQWPVSTPWINQYNSTTYGKSRWIIMPRSFYHIKIISNTVHNFLKPPNVWLWISSTF